MGGDVACSGMRARVAAHGHVRVILVLIHTYVADEKLGRKGLAKTGVKAALATVGLAVVLSKKSEKGGKKEKERKRVKIEKKEETELEIQSQIMRR